MQQPRTVILSLSCQTMRGLCCIAILATTISPAYSQDNAPKAANGQAKAPALGQFSPPPVIPAIMKIEKPLMTGSDEKNYKAKNFNQVVRANKNAGNAEQKILDDAAKFYIHRMSMKSHRHELQKLREELQRVLQLKVKPGSLRNYFLQRLAARCAELLDGNHHVRMNAVFQLSELDEVPANQARKIPAVAFAGSLDPLMTVIKDKDQPQGIKIAAVRGVIRIIEYGNPDVIDEKIRYRVAEGFVPELKRKDIHSWYSRVLAKGLGVSGITYNRARKEQFVPVALLEVINDKQRDIQTRCEAAKSIGRLPLDSKSDIKGIMGGLVNLGHEMSMAYNKAPNLYFWKDCYFDLYFTFRAANSRIKPVPGLLNNPRVLNGNNATLINGAYKVILPLVKHVLKNKPELLDQKKTDDVADWLNANQLMRNGTEKQAQDKTTSAEAASKETTVEAASISK